MVDNILKERAFKLKGRLYTLTVLQLDTLHEPAIAAQLSELTSKAPLMFVNTPVVLDLNGLKVVPVNFDSIVNTLRSHSLIPVALQNADTHLAAYAKEHGLALLHASSHQDKQYEEIVVEKVIANNKLLTTPVRSGQQVVCKSGDLVIAASVSQGAELLADGNIHVYGALRGRALAGISGNKNARIFCQSLAAELVSIAGCYRLSDAIEVSDKPCQIYLKDNHICIEPLC